MLVNYLEAALHRALIRTSKQADLLTREAVPILLRELFDGERVYLKELPERAQRKADR